MSNLLAGHVRTIVLPEQDVALARTSSESLASLCPGDPRPVTLRFNDPSGGEPVETMIPGAAMRVLRATLAEMASGNPVTLVPLQAELSTQQASELMGVSRPYFVKLLEAGDIPFRKVGEQRRVRSHDLLRYMEQHQAHATEALSRMTAEAQELGLYE